MDMTLVVVRPFGRYLKGARIGDAETVTKILAGEDANNVVRVPISASNRDSKPVNASGSKMMEN